MVLCILQFVHICKLFNSYYFNSCTISEKLCFRGIYNLYHIKNHQVLKILHFTTRKNIWYYILIYSEFI